jgi:hypothetical protein
MATKIGKLSILIIFIAVLFIQTVASSGSIYAIARYKVCISGKNSDSTTSTNQIP